MMPNNAPPHSRRHGQGQHQHQHEYQYNPYGQPPPNPYYGHGQFPPQAYYYPPPYNQQQYNPQPQYNPQAYPRQYQQQPPPPPPPVQQQHAPMIVSSHLPPQSQPFYPAAMRHHMPTPPAPQPIQTPPQVPPPASMPSIPSAPSISSVTARASPALSAKSAAVSSPPPQSAVSRVSVNSEPPALQLPTPQQARRGPPFRLELPWLSNPTQPFPPRARHKRRVINYNTSVVYPLPEQEIEPVEQEQREEPEEVVPESTEEVVDNLAEETSESQTSTLAAASDHETPATSQAPSETGSEAPMTPVSVAQPTQVPTHRRTGTKPVVPIIPKFTKPASPAVKKDTPAEEKRDGAASNGQLTPSASTSDTTQSSATLQADANESATEKEATVEPAAKAPPKSWAELLKGPKVAAKIDTSHTNGVSNNEVVNGTKPVSAADAIRSFSVDNSGNKINFFQPRGLVNSGNMCYMNSVLQVLAFCTPFYDFLDLVGKRVAHKIKSDTPLLDAMIEFLREFPVIDSADSVEQLRLRLKKEELEQFGDSFTPDYVYDATKSLPRFSTMRRGHQQDAEEYLNFLLETLHDECAKILGTSPASESNGVQSPVSSMGGDAGWQEVGPKQKSAVSQSSGNSTLESPIAKIFGGMLRSELRVPGKKNSLTYQPYQPLQLDIGAPEVHNIVDALKGLTRSETIHGDFNPTRGKDVAATKQIFIDTLPPVLILHLKRFQYDNKGGTQKIWKKVGYPLELTMPREVFNQQQRNTLQITGFPKYRLTAVIYHHGKNATSGHYTVDVRRQEGREWIRIDDTLIRRLRSEDVASGGAEEDPKILAKALQQHQDASAGKTNIFDQFGEVEDEGDEAENGGVWNQANGSGGSGGRKWSSVANGVGTPKAQVQQQQESKEVGTPKERDGKDSKVAYILFYRRI
ncbi:cysteine proteinase [Tothia fuscella]|uniref:Ubiquitin carboxyl-terminal hydrolase n=1 Tax=Tothia fuscella TaxID=1048955 RepID=A0A9P4NWF5_9PEZI|nr:cysteine proteinase [Tothia fuscella]